MPNIQANAEAISALLNDPEVAKGLRDIAAFGGATTTGRARISEEVIQKIALLDEALKNTNASSSEAEKRAILRQNIHGSNLGGLISAYTNLGASNLAQVLRKFNDLYPDVEIPEKLPDRFKVDSEELKKEASHPTGVPPDSTAVSPRLSPADELAADSTRITISSSPASSLAAPIGKPEKPIRGRADPRASNDNVKTATGLDVPLPVADSARAPQATTQVRKEAPSVATIAPALTNPTIMAPIDTPPPSARREKVKIEPPHVAAGVVGSVRVNPKLSEAAQSTSNSNFESSLIISGTGSPSTATPTTAALAGTEWKSPVKAQKPARAVRPSITTSTITAHEAVKLNFDPDLLSSTADLVDRLMPPTLSGGGGRSTAKVSVPATVTTRAKAVTEPAARSIVASDEFQKTDTVPAKRLAKAEHAHHVSLAPAAPLTKEEQAKAVEAGAVARIREEVATGNPASLRGTIANLRALDTAEGKPRFKEIMRQEFKRAAETGKQVAVSIIATELGLSHEESKALATEAFERVVAKGNFGALTPLKGMLRDSALEDEWDRRVATARTDATIAGAELDAAGISPPHTPAATTGGTKGPLRR